MFLTRHLENTQGYAAALEITEVSISPEGEPGTKLNGRYRIKTDRTRDFSEGEQDPFAALQAAATDALSALPSVALEDGSANMAPGMGHNGPPNDAALTKPEQDVLVATLRKLATEAATKSLQESTLREGDKVLSTTSATILQWIAKRVKLIEEGFFRQIGSVVAGGFLASIPFS